jgi:hypothetical protein
VADGTVFDRYGIESVVGRIDDLYEQILATRPRRAQRTVARRRSPAAPRTATPEVSAAGSAGKGTV